ncbi:MAG: response regulator transcription factor [Acidimicrobiales bacterium]|jgi:two-component system response regulator RegX3
MPTTDEKVRVLVVEDEESYREAMSSGLRREGYEVDLAADGIDGLARFAERPPDIVLLDVLLPGMHGNEVCRRMRQIAPVPIVIVSAVDTELDVVLGLELGAAGYVTKPFHLRELVARMQAILRRVTPPLAFGTPDPSADGTPGPAANGGPTARSGYTEDGRRQDVTFGSAAVDFVRREVAVDGEPVHLSRREFDLLAVLLSPARQVRTRDELIDLLWPDRYLSDSRTLDTHIHRLRTKLEPDPASPTYIVTVRGVGFRIDPDGTRPPPPPRS